MIAIGADHAGFALKEILVEYLRGKGLEVKDFGVHTDAVKVDYPPIAFSVAQAIHRGNAEWGILVCGTGVGMSIAANKVKGIRAALCTTEYVARMSREHNDANVLVLGGWVVGKGLACQILDSWMGASFVGGIHQNRVQMIQQQEEGIHGG
ncbi:MAG: ribose 5-phosphate isomerase B [Spirochaetes bacterium]|nr:ribose 5-phosphate isomerase B [Spirochaetota bacterium]